MRDAHSRQQVFQSTEEAQPVKERPFRVPGKAPEAAAKKADAPKQKKKDEVSKGDLGLDPRAVALPGEICWLLAHTAQGREMAR